MVFLAIAVPVPLRKTFHYTHTEPVAIGARVLVSFANRELVGIVVECQTDSAALAAAEQINLAKLKAITTVLDPKGIFSDQWLGLLKWTSSYYQHPIGEVLQTALPSALRKSTSSSPKPQLVIQLNDTLQALNVRGSDLTQTVDLIALKRAPKQHALACYVAAQTQSSRPSNTSNPSNLSNPSVIGINKAQLRQQFGSPALNALLKKEILVEVSHLPAAGSWFTQTGAAHFQAIAGLSANVEQSIAITGINSQLDQFGCFLLEGITGSGKTEVYLQVINQVLQRGQQVLILVPEIGLTPQTVSRFEARFGIDVGVLHSGLSDNERLAVWQQARLNQIGLVIGTRSAIFTPLPELGMIIIDEEHDDSFKQQDGLRYHARDVAIMLAQRQKIPIILGTATPVLETLQRALTGKFQHFVLAKRAGDAAVAPVNLIDICQQPLTYGLAPPTIEVMQAHLAQGNQVLLFINRRGFAPAVVCQQCGHVEDCRACDKPMTYHKAQARLVCHQCLAQAPAPHRCSACGATDLMTQGVGTEQLEQGLVELFPQYSTIRIDSDSMRGKQTLANTIEQINQREHQILLGTQILAKGHHFAHVTCVVIMDVDGALFSADFRAPEKLSQLITQISGRAGRADKPGETFLQTTQPGHPLLQDLVNNGYGHFARFALHEREQALLPPYSFQAVFRAEDENPQRAMQVLQYAKQLLSNMSNISTVGPVPCLIEKKQARYRYMLIIQSPYRDLRQKVLATIVDDCNNYANKLRVRWSIDVDNIDFN
jgi:primosomal protein N' (replication factor Y)